jgi:hypothetical protein
MAQITSKQVWQEVEKQLFAVLGMVTAKGEARTVGIVYIVRNKKLYISTQKSAWKARHISDNRHVSLTVPIHKRIPFLPWIKIPAATITFSGVAQVLMYEEVDAELISALSGGKELQQEETAQLAIIEVTPLRDFVTYGVGVSTMDMRDTDKARGRIAV